MIRYCTELQSVQYLNPHAVSVQEEEHMKKREHGSRRKNCKTREGAIWHSCNKKRTTHQKCVRCTRKHGTCFTC